MSLIYKDVLVSNIVSILEVECRVRLRFCQVGSVKESTCQLETQEMQILSLAQEDPLSRNWQPTSSILTRKSHG